MVSGELSPYECWHGQVKSVMIQNEDRAFLLKRRSEDSNCSTGGCSQNDGNPVAVGVIWSNKTVLGMPEARRFLPLL